MKMHNLVQKVTEDMKLKDMKVTIDITKGFLKSLEKVVDEAILEGDEVSVIGVKFSTKEQEKREGTLVFGSRKGETYTVPAKVVPKVKMLPAKKKALTKEK